MKKCRICNYKIKRIINLGKIALVGEPGKFGMANKHEKTNAKQHHRNSNCFLINSEEASLGEVTWQPSATKAAERVCATCSPVSIQYHLIPSSTIRYNPIQCF